MRRNIKWALVIAVAGVLFAGKCNAHPDTDATKRPCHDERTPCRIDGK